MRCPAALLFVVILLSGCDGASTAQRADAQSSLDAASEAAQRKDYVAAEAAWTRAIEIGSLNPDQYVKAHLQRAICRARNKKFSEALADLDTIRDVAPNMDEYHAARSFVLGKQGNDVLSRAEMQQARRLNPAIQPIKD